MYFDNLTIAGIAVALMTALLPLLFGKEALRVVEDEATATDPYRGHRFANTDLTADADCGAQPEPCR